MFFRKKNKIEAHAKKLDTLVTTLIVGGAVASMVGLSKTKKGKKVTQKALDNGKVVAKKGYALFGQGLVKVISIFDKK